MRFLSSTLLVLSWSAAGTGAEHVPGLVQSLDRMSCANTVIIARASCHGTTPMCVRETLTFHRPEGRIVLAPHKHLGRHTLPAGNSVDALDYRISDWSCIAGVNGGGSYVAVIMARAGGGNCSTCEYDQLYHPSGRLFASTLRFDAEGRPLEDPKGQELIKALIGGPPHIFRGVYAK